MANNNEQLHVAIINLMDRELSRLHSQLEYILGNHGTDEADAERLMDLMAGMHKEIVRLSESLDVEVPTDVMQS